MHIYNLFTPKLFQSCINLFQLSNTKGDILKNVGNQTVYGIAIDFHSTEIKY